MFAGITERRTVSEPLSPKQALQNWAIGNRITPVMFAAVMGYTYNHAYQILRGNADVTFDVLGRFTVAYGPEAAARLASAFALKLAKP